jgi:hypothetical protein
VRGEENREKKVDEKNLISANVYVTFEKGRG